MAAGLRECIIAWEDVPDSGSWNVLAFDAVVKEQRSGQVQVTSYPVDKGFIVSDHAIKMNRIFQIDSITSGRGMALDIGAGMDYSTAFNEIMLGVSKKGDANGEQTWDSDGNPISSPAGEYSSSSKWGSSTSSLNNRYKLDEIAKIVDKLNGDGTIVHLSTLRGVYQDCIIKQYTYNNDANTSVALPMTLVIEQLTVVKMKDGEATVQGEEGEPSDVYPEGEDSGSNTTPQANAVISARSTDRNGVDTELLANSKITEIPFSRHKPTNFIYNNINYTLSKFRYNIALERWTTSLRWSTKEAGLQEIRGIILTSGVDLLAQYNTGIPSLVIVNGDELKFDAQNIVFLKMFIVENYKEIFVGP